ncbi:MAG TPA: glucan biosynthesis glucosyltransferase H, partial [Pseudomonas sp.]|nr:glucan biosynthesis glucosyltransferase H [Pseudomonas sp.]
MSNPSLRPVSLGEYLAHLPLSDEQRAELATCTSFSELHQRLAATSPASPAEAVQASVGSRLTVGTAGELEEAEMLGVDGNGRLCLKIAPPITRTKVVPEPWRTNLLVR